MIPIQTRIRRAVQVLGHLDRDLDFKNVPREDLLSMGHDLATMIKRMERTLAPIKVILRTLAAHMPAKGSIRFDGAHSAATIESQPPTIAIRKDADMAKVKAALGAKFDLVFESTYKLCKGYDLDSLSPEERLVITPILDIIENPAKVTFQEQGKNTKSSEPLS